MHFTARRYDSYMYNYAVAVCLSICPSVQQ